MVFGNTFSSNGSPQTGRSSPGQQVTGAFGTHCNCPWPRTMLHVKGNIGLAVHVSQTCQRLTGSSCHLRTDMQYTVRNSRPCDQTHQTGCSPQVPWRLKNKVPGSKPDCAVKTATRDKCFTIGTVSIKHWKMETCPQCPRQN